jgi:hypothetical protein
MTIPPAIRAASNFLSLVTEGGPPSIKQLTAALDALALAYHEASECMPSGHSKEPPDTEYQALYKTLSLRFPELGYYAVSDPTKEFSAECTTSDAIEDLADIVRDLREIIWRFSNESAEDAIWYFRRLFEMHWGRHLRELSLYLHAKQF